MSGGRGVMARRGVGAPPGTQGDQLRDAVGTLVCVGNARVRNPHMRWAAEFVLAVVDGAMDALVDPLGGNGDRGDIARVGRRMPSVIAAHAAPIPCVERESPGKCLTCRSKHTEIVRNPACVVRDGHDGDGPVGGVVGASPPNCRSMLCL